MKTKSKKNIDTPAKPAANIPHETVEPVQSPLPPPPPQPQVPNVPAETPLKMEATQEVEEDVPLERKNKYLYIFGIIFVLIVSAVSIFVYFLYRNNQNSEMKSAVKRETVIPTQTPTPIPFKTSDWNLEVLNGSKTSGLANKVAEKIKTAGFQVIKVGNADKSDYSKTNIYIKESLTNYQSDFMKSLESVFKDATYSGTFTDSTASARIILGK